jgi:hypothetical protein
VIRVDHVVKALLYIASPPLDANVQFHHGDGDEDAVDRAR